MKIGIFTVCMPEYEPLQAIEKAAALGYNGLEWRTIADDGDKTNPSFWSGNRTSMTYADIIEHASELRTAAEKAGIEMPSLASYISCFDLDAVENTFKAVNAIGARSARVNCSRYEPEIPYKQQIEQNREQFGKVEKLAKKYGVRALTETHMGMLTPTVCSSMQVLDGMDPAYVGIMWDPGNQVYEGRERFDMAVRTAGPYLGEVHVKNGSTTPVKMENGRIVWNTSWTQLMCGQVDWCAVVAELKLAKYDGWFMLEDFSTLEPLDARLKHDIDFLRGSCGIN